MSPDYDYGIRIAQLTKLLLEGEKLTRAEIAVYIPLYRDIADMTRVMDEDFETLERAGLRIVKEGTPLMFSLAESTPDMKQP